MNIPSVAKIDEILNEAGRQNPGNWVQHSRFVGLGAKIIAERTQDLDGEAAYAFGALHDIGRRFGLTYFRHMTDGYHFMWELGYPEVARICITHSFQLQDIRSYGSPVDCGDEDYELVKNMVENSVFDDYDRLIQLCDVLATSQGFCILEKRMVDAALRHGVGDFTVKKWKACFDLKDYFEKKIREPIYPLLPDIIWGTLSFRV